MKSKTPNLDIMQSFTVKSIPDLDVCVLGALELLMNEKVPKIKVPYKRPLVVGSGNAEATGKIIFKDFDAVFASESDYEEKLKKIKEIDGVVLVSASGEKHAPIVGRVSSKYKKHLTLISTNPCSSTAKYLDHKHKYDEFIFPKQREPYTYNTSTYMGMILGYTKEDVKEIYGFVNNRLEKMKMPDFGKYKRYYLIVPPEFVGIKRMLEIKFIELFGRSVARDIETMEYVPHATTVVPSKDELFITFGDEQNKKWGENRLQIPLPKNAGYGAMMAVGYWTVGQIQKKHKGFKKNIVEYVKKASKIFGKKIEVIVE